MAKRTAPKFGFTEIVSEKGQIVNYVNDHQGRPLMDLVFQPSTYYYLHRQWRGLKKANVKKEKWHYGTNYDKAIVAYNLVKDELNQNIETFLTLPDDSIRKIGKVVPASETPIPQRFSKDTALSLAMPLLNENLKSETALEDEDVVYFLESLRNHFMSSLEEGSITADDFKEVYNYYQQKGLIREGYQINEDVLMSIFRSMLINDTDALADKLKLPCLKQFKEQLRLYREPQSLYAVEVVSSYKEQATCGKNTQRRAVRYFERFIEVVKKNDLTEIGKDDIAIFKDHIRRLKDYKTKTRDVTNEAKNAFVKDVKTVLDSYSNDEEKSKEDAAQAVLKLITESISSEQLKGRKAQKWDVNALYEFFNIPQVRDDKQLKLMFLLVLNCGWNSVDVSNFLRTDRKNAKHIYRVKESNPDFQFGQEENESNRKYIREYIKIEFPRHKTDQKYDRECVLWEKTASLLEEYLEDTADLKSDYVFINPITKDKYSDQYLSNRFGDFFDANKNNLPKIKLANDRIALFKHLRSTLSTIAHENWLPYLVIDLFLGHSQKAAGEIRHYVGNVEEDLHSIAELGYKELKRVIDTL